MRPQLIFVTGKGGVGKTSVTASLALWLSSQKKSVATVEIESSHFAGYSFPSYSLSPKNCFVEYVSIHLPSFFAKKLAHNRFVQNFIQATPGLPQILLLGKIASLVRSNQYEFILVDAPATGHTLSLLDAPRIALKALTHGPLKQETQKIVDLLSSDQTGFLLVMVPESMPTEEGLELYKHLTTQFSLQCYGLVMNRVIGLPFNPAEYEIKKKLVEKFPTLKRLSEHMLLKWAQEVKYLQQLEHVPASLFKIPNYEGLREEKTIIQNIVGEMKSWTQWNSFTIKK